MGVRMRNHRKLDTFRHGSAASQARCNEVKQPTTRGSYQPSPRKRLQPTLTLILGCTMPEVHAFENGTRLEPRRR